MVVGGWKPCILLCHHGTDKRRNLQRLSAPDRRDTHAAKSRLRLHPEQSDLPDAGTNSGCRENVSPEEAATRRCRGGLSEHDETGRTRSRSEALAQSGG